MANLSRIVEDSFRTYAGMVIVDRAIVDVRDCLKPSPRVLLYNQYRMKNFSTKDYIKSAAVVGEALKTFYYHGDQSCYDMYCRMAAPFAMRYPLEHFHGNYGTLEHTGNAAAMRYTEMRLSDTSTNYLFAGLNKNAIEQWRDNFDETDKSPSCLPSIGFYNIVNGSIGLGIAVSSSIPQFNLREVNKAIIQLIQNPDIATENLICLPDFATGGLLLNAAEVRTSLKQGHGKAVKLRAVIEYDGKKNCLHVSELPYSVYSETIKREIAAWLAEEPDCGIEDCNDRTADSADLDIYLSKTANPSNILKKLYAKTSLETSYGINMLMLDHGRFPRVFGWKEALQAYIDHIRECKHRELEFDYNKLAARNHILDGLLIAIADIDETIHIIKTSENSNAAKVALMQHYSIDEEQAKAILDIKLARLAHIEALELETERKNNAAEMERLNDILTHSEKLDAILISILQEVADKFGDERRTKIITVQEEAPAPIEEKEINVNINNNKLKISQKKTAGTNIATTNLGTLVCVTEQGQMYKIKLIDIEEGKIYNVPQLIETSDKVIAIYDLANININKWWLFITKQGLIKKTNVTEYNYIGKQGTKMLKLRAEDSVVAALLSSNGNDTVGIITSDGYYNNYQHSDINPIGKTAQGIKAITLNSDQYVSKVILNDSKLQLTSRGIKGVKLQ